MSFVAKKRQQKRSFSLSLFCHKNTGFSLLSPSLIFVSRSPSALFTDQEERQEHLFYDKKEQVVFSERKLFLHINEMNELKL
jgi:hypothetical protein